MRDDGELRLRPHGDDGLGHGPPGAARRAPPRGRRLPPRPACDQVRGPGRGPVAARVVDGAGRQSIRPTASARSPTASTSTAAIASIPRLDEQPVTRLQDWAASTSRLFAAAAGTLLLGDVNTSLIKTARGRTIVVQHCTNCRAPTAASIAAGHEGAVPGYPHRLYIEGRGRRISGWMRSEARKEFEHPLGRRSRRARPGPATAAWTSSRTTG